MTDNEIIKALECCATASGVKCHDCPYRSNRFERHCAFELAGDALTLINRQRAAISKLVDDLEHEEQARAMFVMCERCGDPDCCERTDLRGETVLCDECYLLALNLKEC